jgi:hypothetical protein
MPAKIAMIALTTSSSIKVKPGQLVFALRLRDKDEDAFMSALALTHFTGQRKPRFPRFPPAAALQALHIGGPPVAVAADSLTNSNREGFRVDSWAIAVSNVLTLATGGKAV